MAAAQPDTPDLEPERIAEADVRALVDEHYDFVWRLLRRLGLSRSQSDDAAQRVFVIASQRLDRVPRESRQSYLFGVALRIASEERRNQRRQSRVLDDDVLDLERRAAPGASPDELAEQLRARRLLDELLEAMPIELRAVFVLYEIEELTMAEIAALLSMPAGSVASRLRRARSDFEQRVARYNLRHAPRGGGA